MLISRRTAQKLGLKRYFTGQPCKNGHTSQRYVNCYSCCQCTTNSRRKWHKASYFKERERKLRKAALNSLGNECTICHFSNIAALQIDHINGNGKQLRKKTTTYHMYQEILKGTSKKYQLLCANCNWIKRHSNNEFRFPKNPNTTKSGYSTLRSKLLQHYGNECKECGISDKRCLQLDHVFGGGCQEYKAVAQTTIYRKALKDISGHYQLLCANCNWIKKQSKVEN
jgi:hypothetical protein